MIAAHLRLLRTAGLLEVFGGDKVKVHDAIRLLGRAYLSGLGPDAIAAAYRSLRDVLRRSLKADWSYPKVKLLIRVPGGDRGHKDAGGARTGRTVP